MGLAAALLVFTGIWHMTEWVMDRRTADTLRLVPVGAVYALLGVLIALNLGGGIAGVVALLAVMAGMGAAFVMRRRLAVRRWVVWAFIGVDAVIVIALVRALLA
ncbi:hypothetical protein [Sphingomonas sp.]|uniref:hypothetical protein n=1 Tax=Sphingomonas sp. TaxID=28214 RepID=UPI001EB58CDC|nr:hypothetical protein [Sphingomonas sp.]MBX3594615.1 hypothetical protein [Sphingomonas sp.]